ncbi:MAG: hypothetical protein LKF53_08205 [Solobacterium sp.]|jgi:hypothetical protein|nr:hypothetical protein [Solobacterium sp.]MCH4206359.1 hypothetical protein [Solobacterium sp.]MCH4227861.1 hypothetical protein [Solobacterium sp.]MCH4283247.1 hypothetical protein [Solobacterium sp.]
MNNNKALVTMITFSLISIFVIPQSVNAESSISPNEYAVQCSSSYNSLSRLSTGNSEIVNRTGLIYVPGSTANVTTTHSTTVSNQAAISVISEFLDWGYQFSYTAGNTIGWAKTNNTSSNLELVVKAFYDSFRVTSYTETYTGSGVCRVSSSNRSVYRGWGYDLAY